MDWTMPRPVLNWVAGTIAALSLGSFVLGVATADAPARLPGEPVKGAAGAVEAVEATPLGAERIEGPPPPPELSEEEKAKLEEEKKAKAEAAAAGKAEAAKTAGTVPTDPVAPPAPVE